MRMICAYIFRRLNFPLLSLELAQEENDSVIHNIIWIHIVNMSIIFMVTSYRLIKISGKVTSEKVWLPSQLFKIWWNIDLLRDFTQRVINQGRLPFTPSIRVEILGVNIQRCNFSKRKMWRSENVLVSIQYALIKSIDYNFWNVSNGMVCTISFSNQNFRVFRVNGKRPRCRTS